MTRGLRDANAAVAGLLYDLAHIQTSKASQHGYQRAAKTVFTMAEALDALSADGIRKIRFIGPASARVIQEYLETGASPSVEAAIDKSGRRAAIEPLRLLRTTFLSYAAVAQVLGKRKPGAVGVADYRGDFQMHSEWSDGAEPLASLVEACLARGYTCACITDHSYGLPIAGGMSMSDVGRQHRELDRLNTRYRGRFRFFKGIEANIRPDARVDMEPGELRQFELVVASPHSLLRKGFSQTDRMLAAVAHPGVHILGHPRGRMYTRPGVIADWKAVFRVAATRGVAVEIDGDWWRQDLDYVLAREALKLGCLFALDSDAHSSAELRYADYALAHARLAGIPPERVINTWNDERILAWARSLRV